MKYAVIKNSKVTNIIEATAEFIAKQSSQFDKAVEIDGSERVFVGQDYVDNKFVQPELSQEEKDRLADEQAKETAAEERRQAALEAVRAFDPKGGTIAALRAEVKVLSDALKVLMGAE